MCAYCNDLCHMQCMPSSPYRYAVSVRECRKVADYAHSRIQYVIFRHRCHVARRVRVSISCIQETGEAANAHLLLEPHPSRHPRGSSNSSLIIRAALHDSAQQLAESYQTEAGALLFAVPAYVLVTKAALNILQPVGCEVWATGMLL